MDLNEIQYFKFVAELGSFSQASRQTGIPKSTLSRKVSELEQRLGVTLLRRTTRQVKLTDVGLEYLRICQKAFADLQTAEQWAARAETQPRGKLRISAPVDIGTTFLAEVTTEFNSKYPEIELEFNLSDSIVDLIESKTDLAVRAGALEDSSLKAQKLGYSEFQLFASPAYLKRHGEPKSPKELESHRCIFFSNLHPQGAWTLTGNGARQKIKPSNRLFSDNLNMCKWLAIRGSGIALIPVFLGHEEVQSQQLIHILKNWGTDREPVHVVYPDQPYVPQRTRLFLEFLKKAFS
jgi:DNA-binding transcriptional LysR family regulator